MKKFIKYFSLFSSTMLLLSCEEKTEINLDAGTSQITVDAWINDKREPQIIKLTQTADYFENAPSPIVLGADVKITDDLGNIYSFVDTDNDGKYLWVPGSLDTLARVGHVYNLVVDYNGQQYISSTTMQPSVVIDSLTQYNEANGLSTDSVIRAEFWARDNAGRQDFYWIRTYRNGSFNNKPNAILTAQEAAFGNGDGLIFIVPYRQGINDFGSPFTPGETVKVEIFGINHASYDFLNQAQSQMINGGLFATPPYNVKSNIKNANVNETQTQFIPVGWFEVSASYSKQITIK